MKTVKIEEKGNEVVRKLAKKFRTSKKEMVNMVLENLTEDDVLRIQTKDRAVGVSVGYKDEDEDDEIEFEGYNEYGEEIEEEEDEPEEEIKEENIPPIERIDFKALEKKRATLRTEAMRKGITHPMEIDRYVISRLDEENGDTQD